MKRLLPLWAVGTLFLMAACAAKQLPPPQWSFARDAILMRVQADPKLNFEDGDAHTLLLCTYQLSDPNTFNQLAGDQDGIYKLLACNLFGDGAVASKRVFLQPDQTIQMRLDRAEGARWVAVVAGYSVLEKSRIAKMVEIPEVVEEKGFFKKTRTRKPAKMDIDLVMGPQQIVSMSATVPEKGE
ncbi:Type VI secretion system outer membrane lipoprotein TssJ [Desulfosarcina cetonica]|uniref:type VI secretion system lipoprotein TssJ n=1 Tax=Desulfosarcina cetonica TaxID=90730 RepID=UPI0006D01A4E|nr:type VI secretion system lipoprotein TssJ [Desulfosarcina cetonica]VTR64251.1 Type VI secretion system outer membrane lipoprotein TssJ [Desulfosarcina cetonica]